MNQAMKQLRSQFDATCRLVYEGETLFRQTDRADSVYLLVEGTVRLHRTEPSGRGSTVDVVAPYASFGDVALIGETSRRCTATAAHDSVVLALPLPLLLRVLTANAPQGLAWRVAIMARLHRHQPGQATNGCRILGRLSEIFAAA